MIRRLIKASLAGTLYHTGLLRFGPSAGGRSGDKGWAVILMYHRVLPPEIDSDRSKTWRGYRSLSGIVVSPAMFESQLVFLKNNYQVMSLEDLAAQIASGDDIPPKSAVITFDDGWRDNYDYAFPILRKLDIPATIFLTADYIGTEKLFWPEKIIALFHSIAEEDAEYPDFSNVGFRDDIATLLAQIEHRVGQARDEAVGTLIEHIKFIDSRKREELIARLEVSAGILPKHRVMLSWEEAGEMKAGGIRFGSHGLSHDIMTEISEDRQREELTRSKSTIEARLGHPCLTLAYPNGNHDDRVRRLAKEAGYRCAVAVKPGIIERDSDLYALNRFNLHENASRGFGGGFSPSQFAFHLSRI